MDIYSFIKSKDIAEHCRKLDHQFTPVEMAILIHQSEYSCGMPLFKQHEG